MKTLHSLTATLLLLTASTSPLSAQNFTMPRFAIGGGGGVSADTRFRVAVAIGQPVSGESSDGQFIVRAGFWPELGEPELRLDPPTMQNGQVGFTFNTVVGKTYTVDSKPQLTDLVWMAVQTFVGTGERVQFTRSDSNGTAFYRVRAD